VNARSWRAAPGPLLLHASRARLSAEEVEDVIADGLRLSRGGMELDAAGVIRWTADQTRGVVLARAELLACDPAPADHPAHRLCRWAWRLGGVEELTRPLRVKGQLGLFEVEVESASAALEARLRAELEEAFARAKRREADEARLDLFLQQAGGKGMGRAC
jgi:hypothetical protein